MACIVLAGKLWCDALAQDQGRFFCIRLKSRLFFPVRLALEQKCTPQFSLRVPQMAKSKKIKTWFFIAGVEHACARCQDQTGALHIFCDTNESESCLVKAPAKHANESVLVVGELLCTGVQANTERHTRKETREMSACWGCKQHSSSRKSEEWRDSTFQQSSRLANLGIWKRHLKSFSRSKASQSLRFIHFQQFALCR